MTRHDVDVADYFDADVGDVVVGDTTASFLLVQPARSSSNLTRHDVDVADYFDVDVDDVVIGDTTPSFLLVQPARCASNHFPVTHVVLVF